MLIDRRSVIAGLAAALAPLRLVAETAEPMRAAGPVYRQGGMPRSVYRPLIFACWQIDEDSEGLLIRHCATGCTFRVVEPKYPIAIQEMRPNGAQTRPANALGVARIGHAARDIVSVNYYTKTYRRARHGGAVYYRIFPDGSRVDA